MDIVVDVPLVNVIFPLMNVIFVKVSDCVGVCLVKFNCVGICLVNVIFDMNVNECMWLLFVYSMWFL